MTTRKPKIGAYLNQEEHALIDRFEADNTDLDITHLSDEALTHFSLIADNTLNEAQKNQRK